MPHTVPQVCLTPPIPVGFDAATLVGHRPARGISPLDQFNASVAAVTHLTGQLAPVWSEELALVLTAGVVSAAEEYFREMIVRSVLTCPLCRALVSSVPTTVGAALSGSGEDALHTSLEGTSFSSVKNLKSASDGYLGFTWAKDSSLGTALGLYDKACRLRHCAVHSGGLVNRRNALALGVPVHSRVAITSPADLMSLAHVVLSATRLYNAELFRHMLGRWIDRGYLTGDWSSDSEPMGNLWEVFVSNSDRPAALRAGTPIRTSAYSAWQAIRPSILARTAAGVA